MRPSPLHTPCTPCILYPTPDTLHPAPYTLHPTPYTLHPTPYTLHPTPYTLHPSPYTLHLTLYTLHPTLYQEPNVVRDLIKAAQPSFLKRLNVYQKSSNSGELQYKIRI